MSDQLESFVSQTEAQEAERSRLRAERIARMKREKERRERLNRNMKYYLSGGIVLMALFILFLTGALRHTASEQSREEVASAAGEAENIRISEIKKDGDPGTEDAIGEDAIGKDAMGEESAENRESTQNEQVKVQAVEHPRQVDATAWIGEEDIISTHALVINDNTNEIVAWKDAYSRINPASMTKVLTVLVAAEHVTNLDDTFTITLEHTDYAYIHDCSSVGFADGEVVTVRDLFYGTILPSGGDAAVALACYVAGSHEAFVELMNEKLEELGISDTAHFTNCVGIYDEDHYCSLYDMGVIMKAAMQNAWCKDVLSLHTYTTTVTTQHPEGITISNWFLRRIEDKDTGGEVLCAKTGFVNQSGNCAVSYSISNDGTPYICVTAGSTSSWRCIYDHVTLYNTYGV